MCEMTCAPVIARRPEPFGFAQGEGHSLPRGPPRGGIRTLQKMRLPRRRTPLAHPKGWSGGSQ